MDWGKVIRDAQRAAGVASVYALAKKLDLDDKALAHYLHGRREPDADACWKLAELNGVSPLLYITAAEEQRAKTEGKQRAWRERRLKSKWTVAASILIAAGFGGMVPSPEASASGYGCSPTTVYYVKSAANRIRRWLQNLSLLIPTPRSTPAAAPA